MCIQVFSYDIEHSISLDYVAKDKYQRLQLGKLDIEILFIFSFSVETPFILITPAQNLKSKKKSTTKKHKKQIEKRLNEVLHF